MTKLRKQRLSSYASGLGLLTLCSLLIASGCAVDGSAEDEGALGVPPSEASGATTALPGQAPSAAEEGSQDEGSAVDAVDSTTSEAEEDTVVPLAEYASFGTVVATVGDSWMHNTLFTGSAISGALKRAGVRLDNYAAQGVTLLPPANLFGTPVSTQIEKSVIGWGGRSQYKTVIGTGGGNDVILNAPLEQSCSASSAESRQFEQCLAKLNEIFAKWQQLWKEMGQAGVADFVYVSYSNQAGSAPVANDYSNQEMEKLCAKFDGHATPLRCTFVDGNDYVHSKWDLILDGIHPNRGINDQIAKGVIAAMDARGITH